jgi:hypothetical protein
MPQHQGFAGGDSATRAAVESTPLGGEPLRIVLVLGLGSGRLLGVTQRVASPRVRFRAIDLDATPLE